LKWTINQFEKLFVENNCMHMPTNLPTHSRIFDRIHMSTAQRKW